MDPYSSLYLVPMTIAITQSLIPYRTQGVEQCLKWLFLQIGVPSCGCPYKESPTIWGPYEGLDLLETSKSWLKPGDVDIP